RPCRWAERRPRLPPHRVRRSGDRALRRDPRRAASGDGGRAAALRSRERATPLVSTPVYTDPLPPAPWGLVPRRPALGVIAPQNDFLHEDGWYAQNGIDISHMRRIIEPTKELVAEARRRAVPVIWTRHGYADAAEAGPFLELRPFLKEGGLRRGTWGYEIYA